MQLEKELNELRAKEMSATQQLSVAEARVRELQTKVREIEEARSLSKFLLERVGADDYRKHLGIISTIRKDFERLSDLLRTPAAGATPIERIVLYIDDLDRCPASTVVDVLQAVHLLLAFPLFVVVVGVDSRWLLHSLERRYSAFREPRKRKALWSTTPQNYLEKIFQIPFALRPMGEGGFRRLLGTLLPETRDVEKTSGADGRSAGTKPASPERRDAADAERAADRPGGRAERTPADSGRSGTAAGAAGNVGDERSDAEHEDAAADRDINPASLDIRSWESEFAARLHSFVPTPRAAKRFSNVYRLLKAPIDATDLPKFVGSANSPGDFRAPMLLLALLTGFPALARPLFGRVLGPWANETPKDVFGTLEHEAARLGIDATEAGRLARCLQPLLDDLPDSMEPFVEWAPRVARFSFETARDLGAFYASRAEPASS